MSNTSTHTIVKWQGCELNAAAAGFSLRVEEVNGFPTLIVYGAYGQPRASFKSLEHLSHWLEGAAFYAEHGGE